MLQQAIRVLLIEDQEADYLLTRRMLSTVEGRVFDLEWARSYHAGLDAIQRRVHDVCLVDYELHDGTGLDLLKECVAIDYQSPLILLTGYSDYHIDMEAMQLGAADFLVKDHLTPSLLERAIRYAIEQSRTMHELRRQGEELRASELRFRSVVQSANDAIVLADDQGKIIFWNHGAERIFGYSEDEVLNAPLEVLMPPHYREAHRLGLQRLRSTGKAKLIGRTLEMEGLRKDGSEFPLELSLATWITAEGTFFTGILRDISDRRRADDLRRAKEEAEQATRAKSQFVAGISHELRTPLHAIIGFTSILLQNKSGNLNQRDTDLLQRVLINARDQLGLIDSILDLSKVEAGKLEMQTAVVRIDQIVHEIVEQFEVNLAGSAVKIHARMPVRIEPIQTDAARLKQVVINLVENALKFTEQGMVSIEVVVNPSNSKPIRIDVTDTGIGIPARQLKRIFEPFHRLERVQEGTPGGTGLGLSISRSICEMLGYDLTVKSEPGRGSTFSIVVDREANRLPIPA
jgi:PAS domain S-box-containing protein